MRKSKIQNLKSKIQTVLPNSTIGVLGSGQLGRMFTIAARRMGYRVHTFSPESDTPTGQVADTEIKADYEDLDAVRDFAKNVDVITFEFENVPFATVEEAEKFVPVRPRGEVLHVAQNRLREKNFLEENNFPVTSFRHIKTLKDLQKAVEEIGTPCVLKTAGFGYDGKGQTKIKNIKDIKKAFDNLDGNEAVLEAFVDFEKEVSVVAARDLQGNFAHYGVIENAHANHILDVSLAPAIVSNKTQKEAVEIAHEVLTKLEVVGVLCIEFFLMKDEKLLVNELAPRPHNSGHLTVDACVTSQFEQQLRAVCGFDLGATGFYKPAAMANLLGDLWKNGEPNWQNALEFPNVKLHLYGKAEARSGRKMGHLTALADSVERAAATVCKARNALIS
ncbi:MAG: 5-(carboxyamino)imidazole ribonucleotide synthase [Acidobacteria bacterium]|nr:5-(carboxyamino)imidazole ribonucleotide synthase [Acidobacteriota bacterium]MCA1638667.1 5-(carboxyamino)imidazole ribonucleotide synthase [Acidobacteriota bacterium]